MMMTGASVVEDIRPTIPGGSMAEELFQYPVRQPVRCVECELKVFEIVGDVIYIFNRHFGEKHYSVIPLQDIGLKRI